MQEFLLILKGDGMNHLSPDELQKTMDHCSDWINDMGEQYLGGQRLEDNGAYIGSKDAEVKTDGPFLEAKEIIAGYFKVHAKDQEEAVQIARRSPFLDLYTIEVRPIASSKM
ncbi:MAG: YciI family protein [Christiangramia sp.]|nr:YciI family protein [Christiangramia sp.]